MIERSPEHRKTWVLAREMSKRREANQHLEDAQRAFVKAGGFRELIDTISIEDLEGDAPQRVHLKIQGMNPSLRISQYNYVVRETKLDPDARYHPLRIDVMAIDDVATVLYSLDQTSAAIVERKPHEWAFDGIAGIGPSKGRRQRWTFRYDPF